MKVKFREYLCWYERIGGRLVYMGAQKVEPDTDINALILAKRRLKGKRVIGCRAWY